jgi:hypothetical protein
VAYLHRLPVTLVQDFRQQVWTHSLDNSENLLQWRIGQMDPRLNLDEIVATIENECRVAGLASTNDPLAKSFQLVCLRHHMYIDTTTVDKLLVDDDDDSDPFLVSALANAKVSTPCCTFCCSLNHEVSHCLRLFKSEQRT